MKRSEYKLLRHNFEKKELRLKNLSIGSIIFEEDPQLDGGMDYFEHEVFKIDLEEMIVHTYDSSQNGKVRTLSSFVLKSELKISPNMSPAPKIIDFMEEFQNEGAKVDFTKPFFGVQAFKSTGKWYDSAFRNVNRMELEMINGSKTFEITDDLKREFCTRNDFHYVLNTYGTDGVCTFYYYGTKK